MNKKISFIGGNGDASVVYNTEEVNGKKSQSLKINGKDIDLSNPEDIDEAIKHFESCKTKPGSNFLKLLGVDLDSVYDEAINTLHEHKQNLLENKEDADDTFDWGIVPWENNAWQYADDYLTETFGNKYDGLDDEAQYRMLKTVAESFEWLLKKVE